MAERDTLYIVALLVAVVLSVAVALYGRWGTHQRDDRLATLLAAMMGVTAFWAMGSLIAHVTVHETATLAGWGMSNIATILLPIAWVTFALQYAGYGSHLTPRTVGVLLVVPVVSFVGRITNPFHGWFYTSVTVADSGTYIEYTTGSLYALHVSYSYLLVLLGIVVVGHFGYTARRLYRRQALTIVSAVLVPFLVNVGYVSTTGAGQLNWTPVAFTVTGLAITGAVFRYQLLDIVPIARESVVETMRDGVVVLDDHDRLVDVNAAAESMLEPPGESLLGASAEAVTIGTKPITEVLETTEAVAIEHGNGTQYVTVRTTPLVGTDGGTLVLFQDVTDSRRTERRYRTLIENASDVVTVLGANGTIRYQSPSVSRVLGYEPAAMVETNAFEYVHPADRETLVPYFEENVKMTDEPRRVEFRMQHVDGHWRTLEATGRNMLEDPVVDGVVVNSRDVTERRRREHELERTNDRLDEFASVVSHDLRNPLNVAEGYLDILDSRVDDDAIGVIQEQHTRMTQIIDDALTMAREGATVETTEQLSLEAVARDAWRSVDTEGATLTVLGDRPLEADRDRLLRVFENWYRNSIEHGADPDRPDDGVSIAVGPTDEGFFVVDDGSGIPPTEREAVFDSGYSTNADGTGFGLSIVDQIVTAHGWTVTLEESPIESYDGAYFEVTVESTTPVSTPSLAENNAI
ncbi:histidine kinase N-terminal 7TM domain-containing protein [Natronosalvus vescus]|uniref:histidine kinase N-terminal 7TM domain-containing protein n=1 Tax=Natronosalvus vescus TaxID=2953881 RepID=UPI002091CBF2|nr:histidine kinase N-terminal 7TM domain-containing protein [Natronosalvus vescus]